jgi:hypothetical protein
MTVKTIARAMLAAGSLALVGLSTNTADAAYHRRHVTSHHFGRYLAQRHLHYYHRHNRGYAVARRYQPRRAETGAKPSCFWTARSMGGPCGCWAEWVLLGLTQHVWNGVNMWLAQDWADHFRHVEPAPHTAAVFPHRHVAPVKAVQVVGGTKMVLLEDSWATHWRPAAGLIFVEPPYTGKRHRKAAEAGPTGPNELAFALMPH